MGFNRGILVAVVMAVAAAELVGSASAATYVVGDSLGWNVPPSTSAYATWASQHTFAVGDVLVFNFTTGIHDVARVTRAAFGPCTSSSPLALVTVGPTSFTLNSTGEYYYICTFGQHCPLGQKLAINVTAPAATPVPAPTPTPTASSPTPTPSSAPTPTRAATPSPTPTPTPSLSPTPSPESAPAPSPSGGATAPSPATGSSPGSSPGPSGGTTGDLSPSGATGDLAPPPPGSAAMGLIVGTPLAIVASIVIGFMI